jgi:hypothetical protein
MEAARQTKLCLIIPANLLDKAEDYIGIVLVLGRPPAKPQTAQQVGPTPLPESCSPTILLKATPSLSAAPLARPCALALVWGRRRGEGQLKHAAMPYFLIKPEEEISSASSSLMTLRA